VFGRLKNQPFVRFGFPKNEGLLHGPRDQLPLAIEENLSTLIMAI